MINERDELNHPSKIKPLIFYGDSITAFDKFFNGAGYHTF